MVRVRIWHSSLSQKYHSGRSSYKIPKVRALYRKNKKCMSTTIQETREFSSLDIFFRSNHMASICFWNICLKQNGLYSNYFNWCTSLVFWVASGGKHGGIIDWLQLAQFPLQSKGMVFYKNERSYLIVYVRDQWTNKIATTWSVVSSCHHVLASIILHVRR